MLKAFIAPACAALLLLSGCTVEQTSPGKAPDVDVSVKPGKIPKYDVDGPDVDVSMKERTVEVPDVDIDVTTKERKIKVPDVDVTLPGEKDND